VSLSVADDAEALEVVVDTDVISYLFRQHTLAERYVALLRDRIPILTAQTVAELYSWPERRNWGAERRRQLEEFIQRYPVIYPNQEICRCWGEAVAGALRVGNPLPATDAWQAATALYLRVPLVTHNPGDYAGVARLDVVTAGG
jgi:tRNA(fMet)-specific endonuclease VapC